MTACAVAALTVYDMVKGIEKGVEVERVRLVSKAAGAAASGCGAHRPMSDAPFRAAVIAVSTSKSAGDGEDESGPKLRRPAGGRGLRGRRGRADPGRTRADRRAPALLCRRGGLRPGRDDGRHRALARRRHAGGDPRRDRPRGARASPRRCAWPRASTCRNTGCSRAASPAAAGRTLIVNFPGNPNAIEQAGAAITPSLGHALGLLRRQ